MPLSSIGQPIAREASIYELLINSNQFDGQRVFLMGYYYGQENIGFLYADESQAKISNRSARVSIKDKESLNKIKSKCGNGYMAISGIFNIKQDPYGEISTVVTARKLSPDNSPDTPCYYPEHNRVAEGL